MYIILLYCRKVTLLKQMTKYHLTFPQLFCTKSIGPSKNYFYTLGSELIGWAWPDEGLEEALIFF